MTPESANVGSPTLGELNRNMIMLRDELRTASTKLEQLHEVRTRVALNAQTLEAHDERLDELEATQTWLVRLIIGAVIMAVLGLALVTQ